jgi:serine/threonine-protein kinase
VSTAQSSLHSSPLIDGKYALLRELGSGAAGTVYEAEHLIVGKRVAVKVLDPKLSRDKTICARFVAEARAAACIAHANVVDIFDLGMNRDGVSYMVMELLSGETLCEIIEARGRLSAEYACELMLQVLAGLSAAHAKGIVHRDLKPANVIVTHPRPDRPLVKVLDFGIAKGVGISIRDESLVGTPMYMAPEQALGQDVDVRADVYAAAAILYELLAGQPPFDGNSAHAVLAKVVAGRFRPLSEQNPEVPPELAAIVEAGLSLDPESRIPSAERFAERLLPFVSPEQTRSLEPRSFRSLSPIPLIPQESRQDVSPAALALVRAARDGMNGMFPPVELVRIDRWSGERVMTDSLLERPRIPRAPSPPRLLQRYSPALEPHLLTPSELDERRAETEKPDVPLTRAPWSTAIFATLIGFGIGLIVAILCGAI